MVQLLFNINLVLAGACFTIGLIMLIGMCMDAVKSINTKNS